MKTPKLSIIVSNYNTSSLINGALESVVKTAGNVSYDVMVIDDASNDGGLSLVDDVYKNDPRFTFVQNEKNVGFSALNIGMDLMHGTYFLILDSDARVCPHTLQSLLTFMDTHPGVGAATANLRNDDGSIQRYYRRHMTPLSGFFTTAVGRFVDKYFLDLRHYNAYHYLDLNPYEDVEIEQAATACLILRREALGSQIVDSNFHLFVDVDLCRSIYNKGYKIYLIVNAWALHLKSSSFSKRESTWRRREYYRALGVYFKKHYPRHALLMSIILSFDRVIRFLLRNTIDHEPMR